MKKLLSALILLSIVCYSCRKEVSIEGLAGALGNPGENGLLKDTGSITGSLGVYDEFSWPETDFAGVAVTLSSGSFQKKGTTDAAGHYAFSGIPTGTYNLSYEKAGFGTMKVFGLSHTGGGLLPTPVQEVNILQLPARTAIDSISAVNSSFYYRVWIYLDTSSTHYVQYYGNMVLLIGNTPDLSLSNYLIMYSETIHTDGVGAYQDLIDKESLASYFNPGDTIYVTACTYTRFVHKQKDANTLTDLGSTAYYVDPANGKYVYPNLSIPPAVLKFQ